MTKQHFIALADTLRALRPDSGNTYAPKSVKALCRAAYAQWEDTVIALCNFCQGQNPRFNAQRWLGYVRGECGPSGGSIAGKEVSRA